jgi:hypothetical protein
MVGDDRPILGRPLVHASERRLALLLVHPCLSRGGMGVRFPCAARNGEYGCLYRPRWRPTARP